MIKVATVWKHINNGVSWSPGEVVVNSSDNKSLYSNKCNCSNCNNSDNTNNMTSSEDSDEHDDDHSVANRYRSE